MPVPGWWLRLKLKRCIGKFEQVLKTHPDNWASMWFLGMIHRRLRDDEKALSWFERAYQVNPSQAEVAREGSMCAMNLGRHETAIALAWRGHQIEPGNSGLLSNLALAFLLSGRLNDAGKAIKASLDKDPSDKISQTVAAMIEHFQTTNSVPPQTTPALIVYWKQNRPR